MKLKTTFAAAIAALNLLNAPAFAQEEAVEATQEYMEFSNYEAGIIVLEQIDQSVFEAVVFIAARDPEQFAEGTLPGAINIQWRKVQGRIDEIPSDKKVITFCTAGSLSAQAAFALRVTGREDVLLLQTGLNGWNKNAAYKPLARGYFPENTAQLSGRGIASHKGIF